jgi:hypothetical protein
MNGLIRFVMVRRSQIVETGSAAISYHRLSNLPSREVVQLFLRSWRMEIAIPLAELRYKAELQPRRANHCGVLLINTETVPD